MPGPPNHDGRGEGHATLSGRPEGRTHQLINRVLLNKNQNECHLWYPVPGLPDHDDRVEGHATLSGHPEGHPHQLINRVLLNKNQNDCHLWYPVPDLPDHDGRVEGHATLSGRPKGPAHQLVNRVLLNKIKMIATSGIQCLASPTTTTVMRAMQRCQAVPKAAPASWLIVYS